MTTEVSDTVSTNNNSQFEKNSQEKLTVELRTEQPRRHSILKIRSRNNSDANSEGQEYCPHNHHHHVQWSTTTILDDDDEHIKKYSPPQSHCSSTIDPNEITAQRRQWWSRSRCICILIVIFFILFITLTVIFAYTSAKEELNKRNLGIK